MMGAEYLWTIPVEGDGRRARRDEWNRGDWHPGLPSSPEWVTDDRRGRFEPFEHLFGVIAAAEHSGFDGVLVPYDIAGEESWVVGAAVARATRWVRTVVEFSPSITTPVYAAKLSATFQRIAKGRLDWKIVVDIDDETAAAQGDQVHGTDRYARADEFLSIARAVWREQGFDFDGRYYAVDSGGLSLPLNTHAFPRIFTSGSSPEALELGAKHADVHVLDAVHGDELVERIRDFNAVASAHGRAPRLGVSLPIIAREDKEEAYARASRLLEERGTGTAADLLASDVAPGLFAGFAKLGFASSIGLLGSYADVQRALDGYLDSGVEVFILDGYPHVEEAYRVGQHVISRPADQLLVPASL